MVVGGSNFALRDIGKVWRQPREEDPGTGEKGAGRC